MIELEAPVEKAFLVAVDTGAEDGWSAEDSLAELANLATTAGAEANRPVPLSYGNVIEGVIA